MILHPWTARARRSPAVRQWCQKHGYITPHFSWASYACQDGTPVPPSLRPNAIKLHWKLEEMRHILGDVPMNVDGPYRTIAHNRQVGGAPDSRHTHADGADFFAGQVDGWPGGRSRALAVANRVFGDGGLGNENSGTLHVDARGYKARFVTWVAAR
jgi:zinc D-Ala-D-Ala carboxypeptidase